jgi:2-hydroxychromene-2-carboxylate isomerase
MSFGGLMSLTIEAYYDFRSPYAYFANHRIRQGLFVPPVPVKWLWRPLSIDVLLNLQAGRDAWAGYSDPLSGPKRAHLLADVRRNAAFYNIPLRAPKPPRPNSIPALCAAALLGPEGHDDFRTQYSTRYGNSNAISRIRACWPSAWRVQARTPAW